MENKFKGIRIEYHILQTFPVSCLNRDDVGAPKTAVIGGVKRARVSSQCWKRPVRLMLQEFGVNLAVRTRRVSELILKYRDDREDEKIIRTAEAFAQCISDKTLVIFSDNEAKEIASYLDGLDPDDKNMEKKIPGLIRNMVQRNIRLGNKMNGLDLALFGRMVAKAHELDIEGAASFSHSITTHKISTEVDYFTALDELQSKEETGSGHLGLNEFVSGTFYRYVVLDLGQLYENLCSEDDVIEAVKLFTKALYLAVPSARQRISAAYCPWNFAHIYVRKGQNMQLAFDQPVKAGNDGYLDRSIESLERDLASNKSLMGSLFGEIAEYVYGDTPEHGIDGLLSILENSVRKIA